MNRTKIEWTDLTWNPVTGCKHGCPYCYARGMYRRFGRSFEPAFHEDRLPQPLRLRKASRVFVCSVADIVGVGVEREWVDRVIAVMRSAHRHTFQILTKSPHRLAGFDWPRNAWVGATATCQREWDLAEPALRELRARGQTTCISAEPLLAEIDSHGWMPSWLIIGAQSGPGGRQPREEWVRSLEDEAARHGTPVFHKPNLTIREPGRREFPV